MAKAVAVLLASLIYIFLTVGSSIVAMIYGWGIEPKNWWIIAASYLVVVGGIFFNAIVHLLVGDK